MKRLVSILAGLTAIAALGLCTTGCGEDVGAQGPPVGSAVEIASGEMPYAGGGFDRTGPIDVSGYEEVHAVARPGCTAYKLFIPNAQNLLVPVGGASVLQPLTSVQLEVLNPNGIDCSWKLFGRVVKPSQKAVRIAEGTVAIQGTGADRKATTDPIDLRLYQDVHVVSLLCNKSGTLVEVSPGEWVPAVAGEWPTTNTRFTLTDKGFVPSCDYVVYGRRAE
jgi:hypothetical protein